MSPHLGAQEITLDSALRSWPESEELGQKGAGQTPLSFRRFSSAVLGQGLGLCILTHSPVRSFCWSGDHSLSGKT